MSLNPRLQALIFVCVPLLLWCGCGYIGEPLPPLMNIPGRGENLAAIQRGSNIIAHVTLPTLTTEGVVIKQGMRLDLRIGPKPTGPYKIDAWATGAKAIGGATTASGIAEYKIPAAEWVGQQVLLAVKIIGASGRDAGWSVPAELTVVAPPEQPRDLTAEAVPQGVGLAWHAAGIGFAVLRRGPDEPDYKEIGRSPKPEYIDATAEFGKRYSYMVQSVVKVGTGEAQSDLSNEAVITPLDTFPPAAPAGLAAVPSTASIELVWERNAEPNVIGYRIYRALGNGVFERLADAQELPTYSDHKIEAGKTYRYAVSAVKSNKVESKLSDPVEVTLP
jgi:fibronectin type 3 domain-containing protein